ncbi:gephyrin-like molybdotransferase receptor GlpR, partial [Kitasatospora sp. DSM 101779]|uniref:divisome protein SepX/GlpR n=1 Tax=Kitasatospora sp. DSM 101779 TaxID=2853165 RepID=UPI003988117B
MSSSGLIYAVIVGAWAAYLVPMWLRRQDELNESRPTERFSTAIRLLAGRSALERRASRSLTDESDGDRPAPAEDGAPGDASASGVPAAADGTPDEPEPPAAEPEDTPDVPEIQVSGAELPADRPVHRPTAQRRARLLARRRRMVTLLFVAFALGAVVAAVAGIAFIWVPAVPAALLTFYIGHLRRLERQRYEVKLDRVRAAQAAERLRAREREREQVRADAPAPAAAPEA